MKNMKVFDWIAKALLLLGGLNWGILGLFNFDLVRWLLGLAGASMYANVAFVLVGIAAIWFGFGWYKNKFK